MHRAVCIEAPIHTLNFECALTSLPFLALCFPTFPRLLSTTTHSESELQEESHTDSAATAEHIKNL